eukprot:gnl/Dysnectes_brevis/1054_a1175_1773.p1 GENE.gnl/Dysnectes_brevis/1054_a1175_1773~~gnl/Dysnectes_brevis/1054_a1175_1773.p1  ORF type:complete len:340 (+),score=69.41 gnl/Dysnectes_brevis/1054_a1175_1773:29-1048(+)
MITKSQLYQLMISQLQNDGHFLAASYLSETTMTPMMSEIPKDRLIDIVIQGLGVEHPFTPASSTLGSEEKIIEEVSKRVSSLPKAPAVDLSFRDVKIPRPQLRYHSKHQGMAHAVAFSPDGALFASGAADAAIKLVDVGRAAEYSRHRDTRDSRSFAEQRTVKPVLKTLYDHSAAVLALDFHPYRALLASGSEDGTVRLFPTASQAKRAFHSMVLGCPVTSVKWHPAGRLLAALPDDHRLRLLDTATEQVLSTPQATAMVLICWRVTVAMGSSTICVAPPLPVSTTGVCSTPRGSSPTTRWWWRRGTARYVCGRWVAALPRMVFWTICVRLLPGSPAWR